MKPLRMIRCAGEIGKAHRPVAEYALIDAGPAMQHRDVAVALVRCDAFENLIHGALFTFKRLQEGVAVKDQHAADAERLVALARADRSFFRSAAEKRSAAVLV